ncbi:MAG: hypothetical protein R3C12_04910 [Planctomycetaceae bacterium]
MRLEEAYRVDYTNLGRLRIDLPARNRQIELREVADIGEGTGPNAVNRDNARRRIVIRCNTQDATCQHGGGNSADDAAADEAARMGTSWNTRAIRESTAGPPLVS